MNKSPNALGKLALIGTLAAGPLARDNAEAATIITDTSERVSETVAPRSMEVASSTLLDMTGTGNSFGTFGLYDGLTFTADGLGSISQLDYTGMPFSEGFVGIMDRSTGTVVPGSQVSFGPSGTLATSFALNVDDLYIAMFKTVDESTPFRTINEAQIPDDSGFINPEAPVNSLDGSTFAYRGQDSYGVLGVQGAAVPEPSSALLAGLGAAGLLTRRRRKKEQDGE